MKSSRDKRPIKFQVRSRPPIFVSQQEAPYQSENESLAARVLNRRKGKGKRKNSQMMLCLGNMGMRGKSHFSLRQKVEDDISSVAWRIIVVND
jgi:hypothetical protein